MEETTMAAGSSYPATFTDESGEVRLDGELNFTDDGNQPAAGKTQSGAGTPLAIVTPADIGALYTDTTNGGLYIAFGATNADWLIVGGVADGNPIGSASADSGAALVTGVDGAVIEADADGSGGGIRLQLGKAGADFTLVVGHGDAIKASDNGTDPTVGFLGANAVARQTVTGALSTVIDAAAKDVLSSIIAALVAYGLATDGTT